MPKYIPGQPDIIVQNMPGGGSLVAANYVYGVPSPTADGRYALTATFIWSNCRVTKVRFDLRKFPIIGSQEKKLHAPLHEADAPYKTIGDIIKAKEAPKCGSTGVGSAGYILDRVMEIALGAKINTLWAIRAVMKSIWPWKRARSIAAQHDLATFWTRAIRYLA